MTISPEVTPRQMANALRALAMDAVQAANSGHPGMPMGMADVATTLFTRFLKFDARRPDWPDRDRFILSAGHGSMLLYGLLHLTGFDQPSLDEIRAFRQLGGPCAGHPERGDPPGVETTTGPLGQGVANAVGMAIAEAHLRARFGADLVNHRTYALVGDGCLMEGISQEAISLAGHLKLSRLILLWDDNRITIDGPISLADSTDQCARFAASGWATARVDGHDPEEVAAALAAAQESDRPTLIACRAAIGYGAPTRQGTAAAHGAPLGEEEIAGARAALDWPHPPFTIPAPIRAAWAAAGARGQPARAAWENRLAAHPTAAAFEAAMSGFPPAGVGAALARLKTAAVSEQPTLATRVASQRALEAVVPEWPELIGGSADLTGSNNTRIAGMKTLDANNPGGRFIHWGVREHAMAAAMNGMALHGGVAPYSGGFLVFSDYCRPAIRLAALMGVRVVHVLTHDSIGLGEDGPTHQPVEHLAALRAIPNVNVFRPADLTETTECWSLALNCDTGPSVIALSRQALPPARRIQASENLSARGAYVLRAAHEAPRVTLIATGSEVSIAVAAQTLLEDDGIATVVVSMPCMELFALQPAAYQREVIDPNTVRVGVEAAVETGWRRWLGPDGAFVGMTGFGASAPAAQLYAHFNITPAAVATAAKRLL